ncbi:MAG: hypothetical protein ABW003_20490 [Microvirga sp.]
MKKALLFAAPLVLLSSIALAETGSGTDINRVRRQVEEMQRDGRWQALLNEGQANRSGTTVNQTAQRPQSAAPTATGSIRPRPRQ